MGITLSSLTISLRTLATGHATSAGTIEARELATAFIAHQGSARVAHDAISFISQHSRQKLVYDGQLVTLTTALHPSQIELPPAPYGLKGGAAREVVIAALGVRQARSPRDVDLIRKGHTPQPEDDVMAKRFMARDYVHGARVELIRDVHRYLTSRDITLNEVALFGDTASMSLLAALDHIGHVIRPSRYRGGSIHRRPSLDGRVLLKMARLFAEAELCGDPALLVGLPDEVSFSDFDVAIQLNKAFQRSTAIARRFVETLVLLGAHEASGDPLSALLANVEHLRYGEHGLLPDVPDDLFTT